MLKKLEQMSNKYGKNSEYVLAGGGNTSCKDDTIMYVKGSGSPLATIKEKDFVSMDREKLTQMLNADYPKEDDKREAAALKDLMDARMPGNENKRPSVETPLHNLFPYKFVLHVHPALINGLTCGKDGEKIAKELLGDTFVWIPIYRPGYALSLLCKEKLGEYLNEKGSYAKIVLLQNHGIFVAADTTEEIDEIMLKTMKIFKDYVKHQPDLSAVAVDENLVEATKVKVALLYSTPMEVAFLANKEILKLIESKDTFKPLASAFTPDHIVYCKARFMYVEKAEELSQVFELFVRDNGYLPKVICIKHLGAFITAPTKKEMDNAVILFNDAVNVAFYAESFGGFLHMTPDLINFICNWEMESYRQKVSN